VAISGTLTGPLAAPAFAQTPGTATAYNGELFSLTNQDRTSNGRTALAENGTLDGIAESRSDDMITNDYFSHVQLNGQYVWPTMSADGIRYTSAGENIAWNSGAVDPASYANTQFMNSPPHEANILGAYDELGVGSWYATGSWNFADSGGGPWSDVYMFTQEFVEVGSYSPPPSSGGSGTAPATPAPTPVPTPTPTPKPPPPPGVGSKSPKLAQGLLSSTIDQVISSYLDE
jgi:hypothetical protein